MRKEYLPPPSLSLALLAAYVGHHDSLLYASKAGSLRSRSILSPLTFSVVEEKCQQRSKQPTVLCLKCTSCLICTPECFECYSFCFDNIPVQYIAFLDNHCYNTLVLYQPVLLCLSFPAHCIPSDLDAESISCGKQMYYCVRN